MGKNLASNNIDVNEISSKNWRLGFRWKRTVIHEMRFVHFLSDFFKAGILGQDIQNPNKVWKVTCKIARVFAEICRFYQKRSLKWPHFARNVAPFFPTKMIFFQTKMGFWNFYRNKYGYLKPVLKNLIAGIFKSVEKSTKHWKL